MGLVATQVFRAYALLSRDQAVASSTAEIGRCMEYISEHPTPDESMGNLIQSSSQRGEKFSFVTAFL